MSNRKLCPEHIILTAQFLLTGTLFLGFFAVLTIVTLGKASITADQLRLADTMFGSLATMCAGACAYWFARQRSDQKPDAP